MSLFFLYKEDVMIRLIIGFMIGVAILSSLSMIMPVFVSPNRHKKWEKETYLQRFCSTFILPTIALVVIVGVMEFKDNYMPSDTEKAIEKGKIEYALVLDLKENKDYDVAYMIKRGSTSEQISQIILKICQELKKEGSVNVSYNGNEYSITENGRNIGRVTIAEERFVLLLKFKYFKEEDTIVSSLYSTNNSLLQLSEHTIKPHCNQTKKHNAHQQPIQLKHLT